MKALIRTNNPVEISFLQALLADAGIACVILDEHTSILEGSIGAIPRRVMVHDEDWDAAMRLLLETGHVPG